MFVVMWLYASRGKRLLNAQTDDLTMRTVTRQVIGGR